MKSRGVETKSESNEVQCWGENPNAQMLRVELRDGSLNLYQYAWLERVQFLPAEETDSMTLFFNLTIRPHQRKKTPRIGLGVAAHGRRMGKRAVGTFRFHRDFWRSLGGKHSDCRKDTIVEGRWKRLK